ncbi:PilZ domain-containing protein [Algicola sagamiensis]|uniref:PilZ domain-containing protein n=1 Tax=Algicola sagamiensis TaxID=163869 RepID=UPI000375E310|nr:PilZ domain-containing protein [Algicola sagamiensis]
MATGLEEFQGIIDRLKPVLSEPDFDIVFQSVTHDLPKPKQFLIKMELKRLGQPCNRFIDLRGHVDGEVKPYDHQGKQHYLDEIAIKRFEKGINTYGGYTIGVYEDVIAAENNHRVMHKRDQEKRLKAKDTEPTKNTEKKEEPQQSTLFQAQFIEFASYGSRAEERMNYSISIELETLDGKTFNASTSDLSVGGCKAKVMTSAAFGVGQKVGIHFRGLEQEYTLGLKEAVRYEIVAIDVIDSAKYLRMKRADDQDLKVFDEFLERFINGNKRRYKVNLDNTIHAVKIKGYEQYYVPRINSLPVYIKKTKDRYIPAAILTNENNKGALLYWRDEQNHIVLSEVFNKARMDKITSGKMPYESLLFTFCHWSKKRKFFYSATIDELSQNPDLFSLFIGFGASKSDWHVFKFQVLPSSAEEAFMPLSIPDTASDEVKRQNRPPSARVQHVIQGVNCVALLTNLTQADCLEKYKVFEFDKGKVNNLKPFGHHRLKAYPPFEEVAMEYVNLRTESRYLYKSKVMVEMPNVGESDGTTRDFSTKGLQVELDHRIDVKKGDILLVDFHEFQQLTKKYKLIRMPYEVVGVSQKMPIINLRVYEQKGQHSARLFFQQLIASNRNKLTAAEDAPKIPGLSQALRNMLVNCIYNTPFFIHRKGVRLQINTVAHGRYPTPFQAVIQLPDNEESMATTYPLSKDNVLNGTLGTKLKTLKRHSRPVSSDLFLFIPDDVTKAPESIYDFQMKGLNPLGSFIDRSTSEGIFIAYRLYISRTGRPDMDFIAKELSYISHYAIHKARVVEEDLWSVVGIGDLIDITDKVLAEEKAPLDTILKQQKKRKALIGTSRPFQY